MPARNPDPIKKNLVNMGNVVSFIEWVQTNLTYTTGMHHRRREPVIHEKKIPEKNQEDFKTPDAISSQEEFSKSK